jgi:hypothetical protein
LKGYCPFSLKPLYKKTKNTKNNIDQKINILPINFSVLGELNFIKNGIQFRKTISKMKTIIDIILSNYFQDEINLFSEKLKPVQLDKL